MKNFQIPENFDLETVVEEVTKVDEDILIKNSC